MAIVIANDVMKIVQYFVYFVLSSIFPEIGFSAHFKILPTVRVSEGWPILSAEIVLNRHKNVDAFFCVQGIFNFLYNVMPLSV